MTAFVPDAELDYERFATRFEPGVALAMDEAYRRAHLPLVAPHHPKVIGADEARGYRMGRHETIWSLVVPVNGQRLAASPAFQLLSEAMLGGPLRGKIDWNSFAKRRDVLHATIVSHIARGIAPQITDDWRMALQQTPPFEMALRGFFSGNINLGRLYLKLYPEIRGGRNAIRGLQAQLGAKETALYVVGLYNLNDDLDASETAWLADALARFRNTEWLRMTVDRLHLLGARDDLALDSEVAEVLRLG